MPPFTRHNPLNLPFSRSSLDIIKSLLKDGRLSPSVSWHPAPDFRSPTITSKEPSEAPSRSGVASSSPSEHSAPPKKKHRTPYKYDSRNPKHAAVLVALANIVVPPQFFRKASQAEVMPSMLLEVRSSKMRSHPGEVSFAGGKVDSTDKSLLNTAIRETSEELGIKVEQIEYLGRFAEPEVSYGGLVVWPFLLSANEVQNVVGLPIPSLKELGDHRSKQTPPLEFNSTSGNAESTGTRLGLKQRLFRHRVPYDVVDVSHVPVIQPAFDAGASDVHAYDKSISVWGPSMVSQGLAEEVEIWGLTGWFLDVFLRKFKIWDEVERSSFSIKQLYAANKAAL
ncbi:hypothetical protein QFC22_001832 [Naganishia vaughanmartiniae]|uniref:Uncharacterized protein n=1 Tax=Naganishia vaughanmartiniae TaxID=1424756 RepID=A0ACC2XEE9_9TREE|nr:hypothetical protein QFC22_001832 [Naganishia vaughanmartiniae]